MVKKRVEYIDLLRGWAVIVMIQTHVFNATLTSDITAGGLFGVLKFIDGLVAPSFLFASGLAYAITTRRKFSDYLSFGKPLFKQLGRLLLILLIAYTLHIPKFSYAHCRYIAGDEAWRAFFQADVLHCIAVSLLILQVLLLVLRNESRLYKTLIGITFAVVLVTPFAWGIDFWTILPVPIAAYMNGFHYSLFPLFPWSAFLFAGSITGWFYLKARDREEAGGTGSISSFMKSAAVLGLVLIAGSFALHPLAERIYPTYDYWRFSPSFVMLRLGIVLLLSMGMFAFERRRGVSPRSIVTLFGRESLIVYVTHLTILYGDFGKYNFYNEFHGSFGYAGTALCMVLLLVVMFGLARAWNGIKLGPPRRKQIVTLAFLLVLAGIFFTAPPL